MSFIMRHSYIYIIIAYFNYIHLPFNPVPTVPLLLPLTPLLFPSRSLLLSCIFILVFGDPVNLIRVAFKSMSGVCLQEQGHLAMAILLKK